MDVHDVNHVTSTARLEPGMIVTIEPGLYFPDEPGVPERYVDNSQENSNTCRYRGMGIRIEDDVLIRPDGFEVLTLNVPKEISEIESLVGSSKKYF